MAIGTHNASYAAVVARVLVDRATGRTTVLDLWAAQDAGLAVNPGLIANQMSGNLVQGTSVALVEALADLPPQRGVRRAMRVLRAGFRAQRASTIGPDLSHRRTLVAHIMRTQATRIPSISSDHGSAAARGPMNPSGHASGSDHGGFRM